MSKSKSNLSVFSQRLTEALDNTDKTQVAIAEKMGVAAPTLSKYKNLVVPLDEEGREVIEENESGTSSKSFPTFDKVRALAIELNVSLDWLAGLSNNRNSLRTNNVDTLYNIARIIDGDDDIWTATFDVVERYDLDEGNKEGKRYSAALCSNDIRFRDFIKDYQQAHQAGLNAMIEYKLEKSVADSMKKAVLDNYIEKFAEQKDAEKQDEIIITDNSKDV